MSRWRTRSALGADFLALSLVLCPLSSIDGKDAMPVPHLKGGGRYANDFGPETLDVSKYPKHYQEGYRLAQEHCSKCHSVARAFNSELVELESPEMASLKSSQPELFKHKAVWRIEPKLWTGYVKKVMGMKPKLHDVPKKDLDTIMQFLIYDGKQRKLGAAAKAWEAHRRSLLDAFKKEFPGLYRDRYQGKE